MKRVTKLLSNLKLICILLVMLLFTSFVHEIGHVLAFRHNHVKVETVTFGIPCKLSVEIYRDSHGTLYMLSPFILGGVTSPDRRPDNMERLKSLDLWGKAEIYLSSIFFNLLFASALFFIYFVSKTKPRDLLYKLPWFLIKSIFLNFGVFVLVVPLIWKDILCGRIEGFKLAEIVGKNQKESNRLRLYILTLIILNFLVAWVNFLPIPGLDGGKLFAAILNINPGEPYTWDYIVLSFILFTLISIPFILFDREVAKYVRE